MGDRRMLSKRIIGSTKFLKMPVDTRDLYFYLNMYADDDGIVEAYQVMKMTGSSEDNLRILAAKEYVKILNEDMLAFIMDWREHNLLRADRKTDSIYKGLLLQIMPEVKLLESKPRSDRKNVGRPMDSISKDKLSKDKLSKVNLDQGNIIYQCEYFKVFEARHNNYKQQHPELNLLQEYKNARQWLIDNNKTMKKWTYITNWLNNAYKYKNKTEEQPYRKF